MLCTRNEDGVSTFPEKSTTFVELLCPLPLTNESLNFGVRELLQHHPEMRFMVISGDDLDASRRLLSEVLDGRPFLPCDDSSAYASIVVLPAEPTIAVVFVKENVLPHFVQGGALASCCSHIVYTLSNSAVPNAYLKEVFGRRDDSSQAADDSTSATQLCVVLPEYTLDIDSEAIDHLEATAQDLGLPFESTVHAVPTGDGEARRSAIERLKFELRTGLENVPALPGALFAQRWEAGLPHIEKTSTESFVTLRVLSVAACKCGCR